MMDKVLSLTVAPNGDVQLSRELLARHGFRAGDEIAVVETEAGLWIGNKGELIENVLDQLGEAMAGNGLSLEKMMANSQRHRAALLKELYGIDDRS
jgi:hypothetical protein